jgi:hypothetical protein
VAAVVSKLLAHVGSRAEILQAKEPEDPDATVLVEEVETAAVLPGDS